MMAGDLKGRTMLAKISERVHHVINHIHESRGWVAALLSIALTVLLKTFDKFFDIFKNAMESQAGISELVVVETIALAAMICLVLIVFFKWSGSFPSDPVPDPEHLQDKKLTALEQRTPKLAKAMNEELIPRLFSSNIDPQGFVSMPVSVMDAVGSQNRYTAVGVIHNRDKKVIGYASFWPVRDAIAHELMAGRMTDSDLKAEHILKEEEITAANYAVIPGFGILPEYENIFGIASLSLKRSLIRMIAKHYLMSVDRSMVLIGFGFTDNGINWLEKLEFEPSGGQADYGDGRPIPIYKKRIDLADLAKAV
jgi:hypothetical protein